MQATVATQRNNRPSGPVPGRPIATPLLADECRLSGAVVARDGESPEELRARFLKAAKRLQASVDATGPDPSRWVLRIEQPGRAAMMPLPPGVFAGASGIVRCLGDDALRGAERLVIEARFGSRGTGPGDSSLARAVA